MRDSNQSDTSENSDEPAQFIVEHDSRLDNLALCASLISVSLIASILVAERAWVLETRTYPRLPITDSILPSSILPTCEAVLCSIMLIALVAFNFFSRKILLVSIFVFAALITIALDLTRLQPWLYLFSVMLILSVSLRGGNLEQVRATNLARVDSALNSLRLCILGTYFYAGIQKFNVNFCLDVVPSILKRVAPVLPHQWCFAIGIPLAATEAALALLLIFAPTRKIGAFLAIAFHLITVCLISSQNWNAVVWPWNVSMALLVYLLFIRSQPSSILNLFKPDSIQKDAAILFFLLLPALNFFGLWPYYLSAALYSGNTPVLRVAVDPADEENLPHGIRNGIDVSNKDCPTLIAEVWAVEELGIPPFPEVKTLEQLAQNLLQTGRFSHSRIYLETFPRFFNGEKCQKSIYLSATKTR